MIATLDARRLALEVAGRWRDEDEWGEAVRDIRAKVSDAEVRGEDEWGGRQGGQGGQGRRG
jgi:hypothetical protein